MATIINEGNDLDELLDVKLDDLEDLPIQEQNWDINDFPEIDDLYSQQDINWFPDFITYHKPISSTCALKPETSDFPTSPPQTSDFPATPEREMENKNNKKRGFSSDSDGSEDGRQQLGLPNKKRRSKRACGTGRVWSLDSPIGRNCVGDDDGYVKKIVRKCKHCGAEKTPQWRMGPMGPKTLCNACGVRYKSGRLVPEYRPAASPSFDSRLHSNSHKRIVNMRTTKLGFKVLL